MRLMERGAHSSGIVGAGLRIKNENSGLYSNTQINYQGR
jgi:hypothetical protein